MNRFSLRSVFIFWACAFQFATSSSLADTTSIDFEALPPGFYFAGQTVAANSFTTISSEEGFVIGPSGFDDGGDAITVSFFGSGDIIFTFDQSAVTVNDVTFTGRSNNSPVNFSVYGSSGALLYEQQTGPEWLLPTQLLGGPLGSIGVQLLESEIRSLTINFDPLTDDLDGDGVADSVDNCSEASNPDQMDTDGDGFGNMCDSDLNEDCIVNAQDLGLLRTVFFTDDDDADFNGDDTVNVVDLGIMRTAFFLEPGPSATGSCAP